MACAQTPASNLNALIAKHAKANGVPEELVHRIVHEESRYQPRAVGRGGAAAPLQVAKHHDADFLQQPPLDFAGNQLTNTT